MEKTIKLPVTEIQLDEVNKMFDVKTLPDEQTMYLVEDHLHLKYLAVRCGSVICSIPLLENMWAYLEDRCEAPTPDTEIIPLTLERIEHKLRDLREAVDRRGVSEETVIKLVEAATRGK